MAVMGLYTPGMANKVNMLWLTETDFKDINEQEYNYSVTFSIFYKLRSGMRSNQKTAGTQFIRLL